ncbi:MAG: hypothetical protein ACK5YQ_00600 [Betaproteobacteria bacterium]|nr:hypothetical protein [Rhodocyclaceae bacterium]MCA3452534.1 hypothetical protein [Rhodobacter sp.]
MVLESEPALNKLIQRVRRAVWTYKQPLTRVPAREGAPVSDLFLWRKGPQWQTGFELTDMAGLYEAGRDTDRQRTCIRLFDSSGRQIRQYEFEPPLYRRQQVDISALAQDSDDIAGTFAVFHPHTPLAVQALGSHLAERGYVSYRYCDAPLRSYVHGNLDAVALGDNQQLALLAGYGPLRREYRLQHELRPGSRYDIAIVNGSTTRQIVQCAVLEASGRKVLDVMSATLPAGGCHLFPVTPGAASQRAVIRSHLVMARPLIFRIEDQGMDVLHG